MLPCAALVLYGVEGNSLINSSALTYEARRDFAQNAPLLLRNVVYRIPAQAEDKTANEIGGHHGVHPSRVGFWKKIAIERMFEVFENGSQPELDWVKKKAGTYLD